MDWLNMDWLNIDWLDSILIIYIMKLEGTKEEKKSELSTTIL